jgi:antitoxin component YwqK of YwqJK toxin-antitoxin module
MSDELIINGKDEKTLLEFVGVDNAGGAIFNYQGKPFTGCIEWYNEDGVLIGEERYTDGHPGGLQREYYDNGQIKNEYYENFGRIDKYFKSWSEAGELTSHSIWDDGACTERIIMNDIEKKNLGL